MHPLTYYDGATEVTNSLFCSKCHHQWTYSHFLFLIINNNLLHLFIHTKMNGKNIPRAAQNYLFLTLFTGTTAYSATLIYGTLL